MDNCRVLEDAVLTKTFVGDSVVVGSKSNLKNVLVKSGSEVAEGTQLEKDYIPSFM
ncbi:uncharacterized protein TOT_010001274 [Theileria orientalis strain Shintoku]|uniref:Glucose-1-phosphate adenylyltransferase n=1 Tax=Theileria orientalis strain Shintoku TaxID=869250 RepID=J4C7I5_THEOR|nr:uncharacterized protein TOT_010001274 [Theileria orientalis strain Shintoku]BAM39098.1 uncharacterized protein TOT_010001274 [Theileria orientalis strain Shintoku]|eukprot:XP_009689399.1 uncharacterized protein TOT_010001274 [Theileria orientalis strain Shintoku]